MSMELLFFDTFSHENNEELNLDLVQFPKPVCIQEVRIIPLGSRVQADFPGGVRLGATNPSSFEIDFFVNDLSKAGASNFAQLGSLEYKQNVTIQLDSSSKIPTDGLVLRGWYSTVTLAVFGILTKVTKEKSLSPPPSSPAHSVATTLDPTCKPVVAGSDSSTDPTMKVKPLDWQGQDAAHVQPNPQIIPSVETRAPAPFMEQQSAYQVEQYTQEAPYTSVAYPKQSSEYPAPDYGHGAAYPEGNWNAQAQAFGPPEHNVYQAQDDFNADRLRPRDLARDYHRRSRSPSRDRDYSLDYKDKDADYGQDCYRDRDHYRDSRHKRGYQKSKEKDSRHVNSRSRDSTPHRDKRPHSPPVPPSSHLSIPGRQSPHSRSRHVSPSLTPPLDDRDKRFKDKDRDPHSLKPRGEIWKDDGTLPKTPEQNSDQDGENGGFEEILSEEEEMFDADEVVDMAGEDYDGDEEINFITSFNPYQFEIPELTFFHHPKLTNYEIAKKTKCGDGLDESANKLLELTKVLAGDERNEKWVENIEILSDAILPTLAQFSGEKYTNLFSEIIEWTTHALDYEKALCQQQPIFKIRHIKSGIKLATALFKSDSSIIKKLCENNVPDVLLSLFTKEHMALSIKLLLLEAIDVLTNSEIGIAYFCHGFTKESDTCYQKLLRITLLPQLTRTMVGLKNMLRKVHLFELLSNLKKIVFKIVSNASGGEEGSGSKVSSDNLNENVIEDTIATVLEMKTVMQSASSLIGQPGRSFPLQKLFEFHKTINTHHPGLFAIFDSCNVLESICVLLTSNVTAGNSVACRSIRSLLQVLISSHHGILYLVANARSTSVLIRSLLQVPDEMQESGSNEETENQQLGLQIAYLMHTMQLVDTLMTITRESPKNVDHPEAINTLHNLFSLLFTHAGRQAAVKILSNDQNLNSLLSFIECSGDEAQNSAIQRSTTYGYAVELLLHTLRLSTSVNLLKQFSPRLLSLYTNDLTSKINEIVQWVSPTKNLEKYSSEDIESLMNTIKMSIKNSPKVSPELITCLRILLSLCISPDDNLPSSEKQEELKYKYALIQVYSHDGLSIFITLLQNICSENVSITNDTSHLIGQSGSTLLAALHPISILIKNMLAYVISCRTTEFKDVTALPSLLETYHFLSTLSYSSPHLFEIQQVQTVIIENLLAYTQPILSQTQDSDEAISKSLWTQMVLEVVKFVQKLPKVFVTGLNILSELLPVPLPIQTREALSQEEITKAINTRKLWCVHLHPLKSDLHDFIKSLCASNCPISQHVLKRVCLQLADLAAPTSTIVVRALLAYFVENSSIYANTDADDVESSMNETMCRIFNLLVYLMSNPAIKVTMLHLINEGYKTDENVSDFFTLLLNILKNQSSKQSYIQFQECILSMLQSLCDSEITLMSSDTGLSSIEQLSNTVPSKDQLVIIYATLVNILGYERQDLTNYYSSLLLSMRIMLLLSEHDYGFYYLKLALEKEKEAVYNLLKQLSDHFSKDLPEFIGLMSTLLDFLRQLTSADFENTTVIMPRTMCMTITELSNLLKWNKRDAGDEETSKHPLMAIHAQINSLIGEEYGLEGVQDFVSLLIQLLEESTNKEDCPKEAPIEPILPTLHSLSSQFGARATFMIADSDDDRLSPSYWFCLPSFEDMEFDNDQQVEVDLVDISEKLCPKVELKLTLEKAYIPSDNFSAIDDTSKISTGSSMSRSMGKKKYQPFINPGKRDFQGSRGRGFGRSSSNHGRANDPFRSRPPNTSRPPSMHVDDFVALENNQSSNSSASTGNTNILQQSKRSAKKGNPRDTRTNRNWGIDQHYIASQSRARFGYGSPYNRRDNSRAGNNPANRTNNRNSANRNPKNTPKGSGPASRNFSRASYDSRQSFGRQRDFYPSGWPKGRTGSNNVGADWGEPRSRFASSGVRPRRDGNSRHGRTTTR